ncbi:MAG: hypothetical protein WCX71_02335 [Candidatus Buchananbacteria bacterium]
MDDQALKTFYQNQVNKTVEYLEKKNRILFVVTSNRYGNEKAKSTLLAEKIAGRLAGKVKIINAAKLKIYQCEGNVSLTSGNRCGAQDAKLNSKSKNPSGQHRCWASINNPDDELWRISQELFASEVVVFFGSIRWGQMNAVYQKLIERLTWIENRHVTLGESNLLANTEVGLICLGHNWYGDEVIATQKKVMDFYGFKVVNELFWHWQFVNDSGQESLESYQEDAREFKEIFLK